MLKAGDSLVEKSLLIISGSHDLVDMTGRILERAGFEVRCADGLKSAQEQLQGFKPDGIILGNELPDGDGFGYFRKKWADKDIPVIFISNDRDDELTAIKAGANDFLKRPFTYEVLITHINMMLSDAKRTDTKQSSDEPYARSGEQIKTATAHERSRAILPEPHREKAGYAKRTARLSSVYLATAVCLAIVLSITVALNSFRNFQAPVSTIPEGIMPLTGVPPGTGATGAPDMEAPGGIRVPGVDNITIPAGVTEIKMPIDNPAKNPCSFKLEFVLEGTRETLYTSEIVKPGEGIGSITLSRGLPGGVHIVLLNTHLYSVADSSPMGSVCQKFSVTAHG